MSGSEPSSSEQAILLDLRFSEVLGHAVDGVAGVDSGVGSRRQQPIVASQTRQSPLC